MFKKAVNLLEKTKEVISEEEAQDMSKKLIKGDFNFLDLYDQMEKMSSMGSLSKIMETAAVASSSSTIFLPSFSLMSLIIPTT